MYRFPAVLLLCCVVLGSAEANAAESAFPYEVQTVAEDVPLRCGPGDAFYLTERLGRGQTLTVYRQAAGGWLAVRPIPASYSLLAARHARPTAESDVVEVADNHAVSWVGSAASPPTEFKWQIRLKPGEKLVVVGEETVRTYAGGPRELHYRIAPPAGEFRWIHEKDVRHASQVESVEPARSDVQLTDFRVVIEEPTPASRDGFVARKPRGDKNTDVEGNKPADAKNEQTVEAEDGTGADTPPRIAKRTRQNQRSLRADLPPLKGTEFEKQLRDVDVHLSLTVATPVENWQLDGLREEVDELIARGGSTVDRGRAELLSEKLNEFEQLQSRFKAAGLSTSAAARTAANVAPAAAAESSAGVDPRFDGSGWLYPVHSRNQAAPPYALLDKDGAILQFVSPAPGLNLHRYLKQEIGVFGQHAVGTGLDKPHVTANRVVSLKRHRR